MDDYIIINDSDYNAFLRNVNRHVKAGYEPCGGLAIKRSITQGEEYPVFYQAMIKRQRDNESESDFMEELKKV